MITFQVWDILSGGHFPAGRALKLDSPAYVSQHSAVCLIIYTWHFLYLKAFGEEVSHIDKC